MNSAIYQVVIGNKDLGDNFESRRVVAKDAKEAMRKVPLKKKGDYYAEIRLVARAD